jgi:hypothetical protein
MGLVRLVVRTFQGHNVVMEVSAMEKNAERPSRTASMMPCSLTSCRTCSILGHQPRSASPPIPTAASTAPCAPAPAVAPTASARRHHAAASIPHATNTAILLTAVVTLTIPSSSNSCGGGAVVTGRGSAEAKTGASGWDLAPALGSGKAARRTGALMGPRRDWNRSRGSLPPPSSSEAAEVVASASIGGAVAGARRGEGWRGKGTKGMSWKVWRPVRCARDGQQPTKRLVPTRCCHMNQQTPTLTRHRVPVQFQTRDGKTVERRVCRRTN